MEERKISLKDLEEASPSMQRLARTICDYERRGYFNVTIICSYSLTPTKIIETIRKYEQVKYTLDYKMVSKIRDTTYEIGEYCLLQSVTDYFNAVVLFFNGKAYSESDSDKMVEYEYHVSKCNDEMKDYVSDCTIGFINTVNDNVNAIVFEQNIARQVYNAKIIQLDRDDQAGITQDVPLWYSGSNRIGEYQEKVDLRSVQDGCYVATAVYGSYDCPEVWTLRRFRDLYLAQSCYGRTFIKVYYAISPILVKLFGNKNWFRYFWKHKLDRLVDSLKQKGYDDRPYSD